MQQNYNINLVFEGYLRSCIVFSSKTSYQIPILVSTRWSLLSCNPSICLDFVKTKFQGRFISRKTEHHWPPYSPDLAPMDVRFWPASISEVIRCQPQTVDELKSVVEDWAANN